MSFLRTVLALILVIFTPLMNLSAARGRDKDATYTDLPEPVKVQREYGVYTPGAHDITVCVTGSDEAGDGSAEAPFATMAKAKEAVKNLRKAGVSDPVTVWMREGEYAFDAPLYFTAEDADNVTYRAYPGEQVTVTGSVSFGAWQADTVNGVSLWSTTVPHGMTFSTLSKNGTILPRTRYPETGFFRVAKEDHTGSIFTGENSPWPGYGYGDLQFTADNADKQNVFYNPQDVCVHLLHYWIAELSELEGFHAETNRYLLTKPLSMRVTQGDRYFFENVLEGLNSPGEWYLDSSADKLYYIPCRGETMDSLTLQVPLTKQLLVMEDCENVTFQGITFTQTDWAYPTEFQDGWFTDYKIRHPQAEIDVAGTMEITRSKGVNFFNCDFLNLGQTAIRYHKVVKDSTVQGCTFRNIGGSGVFVDGYNTENESLISEGITVRDNLIQNYGTNFSSAIGVLATHARNCDFSHNEITEGRYTAISVGWVWGYAYSVTCNNKICDNLIYNIGQGWLSDMGGIYTLGKQPGTVLSGNTIYNVAADEGQGGYGGWGIYLDEGSSDILVENNLVYDCGSQGFHQHYGKDNLIRNNIFALNRNGQTASSRKEGHNQFTFTGNIFVGDDQPMYAKFSLHEFKDDGNLYWDYTRGAYPLCSLDETFKLNKRIYPVSAKNMGFYQNATIADPNFRDAKNYDFTLPDNAKVTDAMGFKPWNYKLAGTLTDFTK